MTNTSNLHYEDIGAAVAGAVVVFDTVPFIFAACAAIWLWRKHIIQSTFDSKFQSDSGVKYSAGDFFIKFLPLKLFYF